MFQFIQKMMGDSGSKSTSNLTEEIQNGAFLVDVRTPQEFAAGSAPGAINIPLDEVEDRIKDFQGKPSVIVFCRSGNRSGHAKMILENAGIQHVTNGGTWQNVKQHVPKN